MAWKQLFFLNVVVLKFDGPVNLLRQYRAELSRMCLNYGVLKGSKSTDRGNMTVVYCGNRAKYILLPKIKQNTSRPNKELVQNLLNNAYATNPASW